MGTNWVTVFRQWGWTVCGNGTATHTVGIAHPDYGIMKLTVCTTAAGTLTDLACLAANAQEPEYPTLYVGSRVFVDEVRGHMHGVVGVIVYTDVEGKSHAAPMTVSHHPTACLPYFEKDEWAITGWTASGAAKQDFKPVGWDAALLAAMSSSLEDLASTRCSKT